MDKKRLLELAGIQLDEGSSGLSNRDEKAIDKIADKIAIMLTGVLKDNPNTDGGDEVYFEAAVDHLVGKIVR